MSFSAHKRDALDEAISPERRLAHLRSCAVLVGQKHGVPRSSIIERVINRCGVDITQLATDAQIREALEVLVYLKDTGLED